MVPVRSVKISLYRMFSVLLISGILSAGSAVQQLVVMHAPQYVTFQQQSSRLQTSQLPGLVANTLGVGSQKDLDWQGMVHKTVFKRPKANVMLTVELHESLGDKPLDLKNKAKFPMTDDLPFFNMENVRNSIQRTFLDQDPLLLDLLTDNKMFDMQTENQLFKKLPSSLRQVKDRLFDPDSVIQKLRSGSLNMSLNSDMTFMGEMQMISDVIQTMLKNPKMVKGKSPDLLSFTMTGFKSVVDKHGPHSAQTEDAKQMLTDFIHSMRDDLKSLYKDNVVFEVFLTTSRKGHSRKVRSLMATSDPTSASTSASTPAPMSAPNTTQSLPQNLAENYTDLFAPVFNIVLWLMILLAVAVYAVAYGIWYMDPGRESIIYRMTSPRLKKD